MWLSLLLALIRVCGIPYELILPLLLGWARFSGGDDLDRRAADADELLALARDIAAASDLLA